MLINYISEPFLGFSVETLDFLRKLKNNKYNNKIWFDKNRNVYESCLKQPMRVLVSALAGDLLKVNNRFNISNKSILRINRDVRFKKDKTPYRSNYALSFTFDRIKSPELPQFYMHIDADEFIFAAGQYSMETEKLKKIRRHIYTHYDGFRKIISEKKFTDNFGKIEGESLERIPKGFEQATDLKLQNLLKKKQFYVFRSFKPEVCLEPDLAELIIENVTVTSEFVMFLFDS